MISYVCDVLLCGVIVLMYSRKNKPVVAAGEGAAEVGEGAADVGEGAAEVGEGAAEVGDGAAEAERSTLARPETSLQTTLLVISV